MEVDKSTTSLAIGDIADAWKNRTLRPNQEYQRGEAWTLAQQKLLIDSILRGYPLPRFYFHKKTSASLLGAQETTFDVIDGQQRIIAIAEFTNDNWNLFAMDDDRVPMPRSIRRLPCPWSGRTFSSLEEDRRRDFLATQVPVVVIESVSTPDEIRDLFIRLQAGTALTRQQVRDAWPGTLGPYIISLAGKVKAQPRFRCFNSVDKRGVGSTEADELKDPYHDDRQTCAQLLWLLVGRDATGEIPSVTTRSLDNLYHTNIEFEPAGLVAQRFERILGWCDAVLERRPSTSLGRPIKIRKNLLFSVFLLLDDLDSSGRARVDVALLNQLSRMIWTTLTQAVQPAGRVSSSGQIARHYHWLLHTKLRSLQIAGLDAQRAFDDAQKAQIWANANGRCGICGNPLRHGEEEYDHIRPWIRGGPTSVDNGRPVHKQCHERGRNVGLAPVSSRVTV